MRWLIATLVVLVVAIGVWLGSAVSTLGQIAASARAGDGAAVLARTDLPAMRRSLTDQIVRAYLERAGTTRKVSQLERMVANTYGATVTDAMVAKFLTADTLTALLKNGRFEGADNVPAFDGMPSLGALKSDNVLNLLGRIGFVQPVVLSFRVSDSTAADRIASVQLHLDGSGWRLAGLELPKAVVSQLAASLPVK